jgi:hypothetical protein
LTEERLTENVRAAWLSWSSHVLRGSDDLLSKVFGITIHVAMLSSVHLCCNVL